MESKILEILSKYENTPADYNFVNDILVMLRDKYHAEDYLKKIATYNYFNPIGKNNKWNGFYDSREKAIYIDVSSSDDFEVSRLEKNIFILVLMLHEFAHVRQKMNHDGNSFENILLKISDIFPLGVRLGDIHDLIPSERLANISAEISCINFLSSDFLKYQNEIYRRKKILYYHFINGYEQCDNGSIISPLEKYLEKAKLYDSYNYLLKDDIKNYSLSERLLYGLNITNAEYKLVMDTYKSYSNKADNKNKLKIKIM